MEKIAALLIAAHVMGDFLLQNDALVRWKRRPMGLMVHGAIHAVASYGMLQAWACWQAPAVVFVVHSLIDLSKQRSGNDGATVFVADQIAHIATLLALAWLLVRFSWVPVFTGIGYAPMVVGAGFIACVRGAGFLVAKVAGRMIAENGITLEGLRNGGRMIGQLERCIIFLFIFIDQPMAIGFLFAAKSILRFEEAKQQKLAEYILIGTLLSFSVAIAIASAARWAVRL